MYTVTTELKLYDYTTFPYFQSFQKLNFEKKDIIYNAKKFTKKSVTNIHLLRKETNLVNHILYMNTKYTKILTNLLTPLLYFASLFVIAIKNQQPPYCLKDLYKLLIYQKREDFVTILSTKITTLGSGD